MVFTAASAEKRRVESRAEEKAMALGTTLCSRQRGRHHKEAPDKSKQKDIPQAPALYPQHRRGHKKQGKSEKRSQARGG